MAAGMQVDEARADRMDEICERSAPGRARLAYLRTGHRALAEDLVQEAFVRPPRPQPARANAIVAGLDPAHSSGG